MDTVYVVDSRAASDSCTVNVLPVAVNYTGGVPNGSSNWSHYAEKQGDVSTGNDDDTAVNYLRGHKLVGKEVGLQLHGSGGEGTGYRAVVFSKEDDDISDSGKSYTCTYTGASSSGSLVLYEHETGPDTDDNPAERAVEWIGVASIVNRDCDCDGDGDGDGKGF